MKLLVTGAWPNAKAHIGELQAMGHTVVFMQQESEALPCPPEDVDGIICNGLFLHHSIDDFTALRYLQLTSAGYDRVPIEEIRRRGIEVYNARDVYSIPMAEFAVGGVLQLYKKFGTFRDHQKLHRWEKQRKLQELAGKTVCIIGCGSVGTACARRFAAFDARVLGVTAHPGKLDWFEAVYGLEQLDAVLTESDVVILTLSLTDETYHLFDEKRMQHMKQGAVLVNISRGAIVDTTALIDTLTCGGLSGAVLDVTEEEPLPPDSPLWDMEQVLLTPHNSFVGERNELRILSVISDKLRNF